MNTEIVQLKKTRLLATYRTANTDFQQLLKELYSDQVDFNQKVTDRINTWADVLEANGLNPVTYDKSCQNLDEDEINYRNNKLIAAALNEGWLPDWEDDDQPKFRLWLRYNPGSGFSLDAVGYDSTNASVGSRLYFKTRELAEHAWAKFSHILVKFYEA